MTKICWLFMFALVLGGCASMSKNECLMADWRLIGFEDGSNGLSRNHIGERRKVCAEHGVVPDKAAYDVGYDEGILTFCSYARGLRSAQYGQPVMDVCPSQSDFHAGYSEGLGTYCTYDRGMQEGLAGNNYQRICPRETESNFLVGYNQGYHVFDLQSQREDLIARLAEVIEEQQEIAKHITQTVSEAAFTGAMTPQERTDRILEADDLRKHNEALSEERGALKAKIDQVTKELADLGYE